MTDAQLCHNHGLIQIRSYVHSHHTLVMCQKCEEIVTSQASWDSVPYKYLLGPYGKNNNKN